MPTIIGQISTVIGQVTNGMARPLIGLGERLLGKNEFYKRMLEGHSEKMRVALPAEVVSFNADQQTVTVQPLIREKFIDKANGNVHWLNLPQIVDVPVMFPQAGNFVLTMPIQPGDEVLLIFQDMCMDGWWYSGGIQNWNMRRRHDLSDAIAIPGINSRPNVIQNIANDAAELRSKDGNTRITVKGNEVKVTPDNGTTLLDIAAGNITLTATTVNINGVLKHNGKDYAHHVHTVTTAPGTTSAPSELP